MVNILGIVLGVIAGGGFEAMLLAAGLGFLIGRLFHTAGA